MKTIRLLRFTAFIAIVAQTLTAGQSVFLTWFFIATIATCATVEILKTLSNERLGY